MKLTPDAWFWTLTGICAAATIVLILLFVAEVYR
jgi:hypothetical protein